MTFNSDVFSNDPAVQFAIGGRTVIFTIAAGSTQAVFPNGSTQLGLQTGTVAGTITLTPFFVTDGGIDLTPTIPPSLNLTVGQTAPRLLSVQVAGKTSNTVPSQITGYATGVRSRKYPSDLVTVTTLTAAIQSASVTLTNNQGVSAPQTVFLQWGAQAATDRSLTVTARMRAPVLEHHLQRQVHITWRIRLPRNYAEISSVNRRARRGEDWCIRQVKCLCPELEMEPLLNAEVLEQREMQAPGPILPNSSIGSRQIAD